MASTRELDALRALENHPGFQLYLTALGDLLASDIRRLRGATETVEIYRAQGAAERTERALKLRDELVSIIEAKLQ